MDSWRFSWIQINPKNFMFSLTAKINGIQKLSKKTMKISLLTIIQLNATDDGLLTLLICTNSQDQMNDYIH